MAPAYVLTNTVEDWPSIYLAMTELIAIVAIKSFGLRAKYPATIGQPYSGRSNERYQVHPSVGYGNGF